MFLWSIASSHVLDTLQRQPEKKSPFLGLRRVQLPATGEAWCRDDLQSHPPGSNPSGKKCYTQTTGKGYKLAAPRKGFYLTTFF